MNRRRAFQLPSLGIKLDTGMISAAPHCPDPWALRHRFVNRETGEIVHARCDKRDCLYCGPRKVNQWRKLIALVEPTLFVTLTKVGKTVEFEENGFHWRLLAKGIDFLPNQVVSDALRSATKGRSYISKVEAVRSSKSIGYVTKYLTKAISRVEKGMREEVRDIVVPVKVDEQGNEVLEKRVCTVQAV